MRSCLSERHLWESKRKKVSLGLTVFLLLFMAAAIWMTGVDTQAAEKSVSATISSETVTVGKQIQIEAKTKQVTYVTSDPTIATVSDTGVVTGKKSGKAVITVKKSGYISKKFAITVKKYGKYPSIPVTLDEMDITLQMSDTQIEAVIANRSKEGTVKKIEYIYEAEFLELEDPADETVSEGMTDDGTVILIDNEGSSSGQESVSETITFQANDLGPGETERVAVEGDYTATDNIEQQLLRVRIYTGKTVLNYNMRTGHMSVKWQVKDTTPPVISGWIGSNGYNSKDVFMVAYSDREYDFKKYVHASDNMGGKVTLTVDTSKINWKKSGVYKITYQATDLAGNVTKKSAKVQVRAVSDLDRMADSILKDIVKDSWSDQKKAEAIYRYMRKNYAYVDSNDHESWEKSALYGLRYQSGNCFVFYSVSRLLLTRCGIPNIEVKRSAGSSHGHWWNYVYIDGGWYHFDTTPRRRKATFCLVTDDQLSAYSRAAGNSHIWDKSLLPKCATKKISTVEWGKSY